jgi:hypothetical protein
MFRLKRRYRNGAWKYTARISQNLLNVHSGIADDSVSILRFLFQTTFEHLFQPPMQVRGKSVPIRLRPDPVNCPGCYWSSAPGVWAKSGPKTYEWTFQGYFVDGYGEVIFIPWNEGTITLTGCNTAEVYGKERLFYPGDDEPFSQWDYSAPQQRLLLHQPSPVQWQNAKNEAGGENIHFIWDHLARDEGLIGKSNFPGDPPALPGTGVWPFQDSPAATRLHLENTLDAQPPLG